ncbi:Epimerase domain-containing protein [Citrus sinensis]|uniref:Epimerase domain-containing protein n=1 Tax=Citrus sinensis TaxID=2711 RepID=A0ACB8KKF9_CITSI|nr:Epimerase domain-containing protein [Citrus sinensis]
MTLCLLREISLADDVLVDERDTSAPVPPRTRLLRNTPVRGTLLSDICSPRLVSSTYFSQTSAIVGCNGVFHVASPVPSSSVELIEPAVKGTLNVLKACLEAKVKRVIVVSSGAAVGLNPRWPKGQIMDETCWSDKEYCRTTNNWYCLSKTEAESEALEFAKRTGLDVVTVCPNLIWGPLLQSNVNSSSLVLIKRLKGNKLSSVVRVSACDDKENFSAACLVAVGTGVFQFLYAYLNSNKQSLLSVYTEGYESLENRLRMIVDVRDVAEALLLAYEKAEAEGRYICTAHLIRERDLFDKLKSLYPNYNYPKNFTEGREDVTMSSEKLQRLGWSFRPLEETLIDSIESYKKAGILD